MKITAYKRTLRALRCALILAIEDQLSVIDANRRSSYRGRKLVYVLPSRKDDPEIWRYLRSVERSIKRFRAILAEIDGQLEE